MSHTVPQLFLACRAGADAAVAAVGHIFREWWAVAGLLAGLQQGKGRCGAAPVTVSCWAQHD